MATSTRGESRTSSITWNNPWPDDTPATDTEILAAVAKSKDLELVSEDELLELVRWKPTDDGAPDGEDTPEGEPIITHGMLFEIRQHRKRMAKSPGSSRGKRSGGRPPGSGRRITREQLEKVRTLLSEGLSRRKVARIVGLSPTSVSSIARGYVPSSIDKPRAKATQPRSVPARRHPVCPTCNHRVPAPCVYCAAMRSLRGQGGAA